MNPHLKTAYDYGAKHAQIMFEKYAAAGELEAGDILARMGGAVPLAGPAIAGETGGIETAPGFGSHVGQRTAMGALRGQTIGGLGGAGVGAGLGALAPWVGKQLDIEALENLEPGKGALIGALLGGGLGAGIGGSIGAGRGRTKGEEEVATTRELLNARHQAAMQSRLQDALQQAYQRGGMEQSQLTDILGGYR
jgi:hypothetical protein